MVFFFFLHLFQVLDYPHVDEKTLDQSRVELKSHLRVQHAQINAMRNDLNDVSFDGFSLTYLDEVTQLQVSVFEFFFFSLFSQLVFLVVL